MQGTSSILLALILGAMIAFDMGGPVNKVAFLFGSAMIGEGNYEIMGPIAAAIAIPPIGMGLATFMNKKKYESSERETGKASFTMGLFGITEGAIPFAAQDPLRVIPSNMAGAMVGAVIAMLGSVGDRVAHGGPIVAVLGAVDNVLMFFIAIIAGSLVTATVANLLKKDVETGDAVASTEEMEAEEPVTEKQPETPAEEETPTEESEKLVDLTNMNLIDIDVDGNTRDDVIDHMVDQLEQNGSIQSKDDFKQTILAREEESTTGIGMNIAIPHGKSNTVTKPSVTQLQNQVLSSDARKTASTGIASMAHLRNSSL